MVALYSIIHLPLSAQPELLAALGDWLANHGVLLLVAGAQAWTGSETGWLGGRTEMWWSHTDTDTYRRWLEQADFRIIDESYVPEGDSGHSLFWAVHPGPNS